MTWADICNAIARFAYAKLIEAAVTPEGGVGLMTQIEGTGYSVAAEEAEKRRQIVAFARAQVGEPYVFGAEGPADKDLDRWDCSELIEHAYAAGGMMIPDGSRAQRDFCQKVLNPRPGDIAYFLPNAQGVGHVVLYAGDDICLEARGRRVAGVQKGVVQESPRHEVEAHARFEGWFRHPDFARPPEDRA